jgi:CheY-like chemotaxis protein
MLSSFEPPPRDAPFGADRGGSARSPASRPTLLLVEDETVLLRLLSNYLGRLGFDVLTAESAEDGLRIALERRDPIDLLVTDVLLPGMTGLELAMQLRDQFPALPAVLITAYPPEILIKNGVRLGDFPLLNKPFGTDDLRRTISTLLGFVIPAPA